MGEAELAYGRVGLYYESAVFVGDRGYTPVRDIDARGGHGAAALRIDHRAPYRVFQ